MVKKIIIANWKMNPQTSKEAERIFNSLTNNLRQITKNKKSKLKNVEIIICPSFTHLPLLSVVGRRSSVKFGAQDVFWELQGAYTGEISAAMLKDLKCQYVIIGHSERRKFGETDDMVNKKVLASANDGLNVILCVGEHYRENHNEIPAIVEEQVRLALAGVPKSMLDKIIIAYEPVWAIGSGMPDTPEGAMMAAVLIRKTVIGILGSAAKNLRIVYGGSVNAENAGSFINHESIDGVLVGGASLDPREFAKIILSAK